MSQWGQKHKMKQGEMSVSRHLSLLIYFIDIYFSRRSIIASSSHRVYRVNVKLPVLEMLP